MESVKHHSTLFLYKALFEEPESGKLMSRFLEALLKFQNVEQGSLWIINNNQYVCIEAVGRQSEMIKGVRIDTDKQSIVGWVIENGEMTIAEVGKDPRHHQAIENGLDEKSSLILCFPLILKDGRVYGAVEILDTSTKGDRMNLDPDYLELLESLVGIGSIALSNTLEYTDRVEENRNLKRILEEIRHEEQIIGQSESFLEVLRTVEKYARTDFPVLITGESGTGKELISQEIHRRSSRRKKPFLIQNCSAIPDSLLESELFGYTKGAFTGADQDKIGMFEAANGGTIFLDEIGDMPLGLQPRILRIIQNNEIRPLGTTKARKIDVRIISATNRDLNKAIAANEFREDLFYRLNVLPLQLPSLRERTDDIPILLHFFIQRDSRRLDLPPKRFSPEALQRLVNYPWKGNIREMENFVRYALTTVAGELIRLSDLPPLFVKPERAIPDQGLELVGSGKKKKALPGSSDHLTAFSWTELEKAYIISLLKKNRWSVTRSAADAEMNRSTFNSRMRKLGITRA